MPQYRVRCTITTETLVDIVADSADEAKDAAIAALGGENDVRVNAVEAWIIAGQSDEPVIVVTESGHTAAIQGEEDGA